MLGDGNGMVEPVLDFALVLLLRSLPIYLEAFCYGRWLVFGFVYISITCIYSVNFPTNFRIPTNRHRFTRFHRDYGPLHAIVFTPSSWKILLQSFIYYRHPLLVYCLLSGTYSSIKFLLNCSRKSFQTLARGYYPNIIKFC